MENTQYVFELRRTNSNSPAADPSTIPPIKNHGSVPNHLSSSHPRPQKEATDANNVRAAAYAKPLFRFSSWSGVCGTTHQLSRVR
jgi:hypothetical protein